MDGFVVPRKARQQLVEATHDVLRGVGATLSFLLRQECAERADVREILHGEAFGVAVVAVHDECDLHLEVGDGVELRRHVRDAVFNLRHHGAHVHRRRAVQQECNLELRGTVTVNTKVNGAQAFVCGERGLEIGVRFLQFFEYLHVFLRFLGLRSDCCSHALDRIARRFELRSTRFRIIQCRGLVFHRVLGDRHEVGKRVRVVGGHSTGAQRTQ
mmetsp:Transcript_33213/g.102549  ORF Transcript_33213/g.102549 Transcript_33213/m.102549 type:complete len:214 (+) Transcript_33213:706-1347(+)